MIGTRMNKCIGRRNGARRGKAKVAEEEKASPSAIQASLAHLSDEAKEAIVPKAKEKEKERKVSAVRQATVSKVAKASLGTSLV